MRRIYLFLGLIAITSIFTLSKPNFVHAATCASFSVTPGSGDPNTNFTATGGGCSVGVPFEQLALDIVLDNGDGVYDPLTDGFGTFGLLPVIMVPEDLNDPNSLLKFERGFGGINTPGTYHVVLVLNVAAREDLASQKIEIIVDTEEPNEGGYCGAIVSANAPTCNPELNIVDFCCPAVCPAALSGSDWVCTPPREYMCASQNGTVGIDSAIGCIPIEDINDTTAFFVRWALGVGGGVALFLIAVSGIKVMTVKDDPKRLQDARDTLSAAIAGIVLIILSVFLVRFLSETLLGLF